MNGNVADREHAQNPSVLEGEQQVISTGETLNKVGTVIKDAEEVKRSKPRKYYNNVKQAIIKNFMSSGKESIGNGVTNNAITKGNKIGKPYNTSTTGFPDSKERVAMSGVNETSMITNDKVISERSKLEEIIEEINNVVEMLLPGQEAKWVETTSAITQREVWSDETPMIQIIMQKLGHHLVALEKLCEMVNQGNGEPETRSAILERFYIWVRDNYQHGKTQGSLKTPEKILCGKVDGENAEINVATTSSDRPIMIGKMGECSLEQVRTDESKYDLTIKELDKLGKRILPLMTGNEIEWVTITRDLTKNLTLKDKKAMLQIMHEKLGQHASASAQAAILLVHTTRWPDEHPDPLEKFYEWLLKKHEPTVGQQLTKFKLLMQNMPWSWEGNPADRIMEIMHEVHLTCDDAVQINAFQDELEAIIGSKMETNTYLKLCEKPVKEWYNEITNFWMTLRVKKRAEKDSNEIQVNTTKITHKRSNDDVNEVAIVLHAAGKRSKLHRDDELIERNKRQKERQDEKCPRCRNGTHLVKNCPLPRKRGRGSRKRNKIKRQKLSDRPNGKKRA